MKKNLVLFMLVFSIMSYGEIKVNTIKTYDNYGNVKGNKIDLIRVLPEGGSKFGLGVDVSYYGENLFSDTIIYDYSVSFHLPQNEMKIMEGVKLDPALRITDKNGKVYDFEFESSVARMEGSVLKVFVRDRFRSESNHTNEAERLVQLLKEKERIDILMIIGNKHSNMTSSMRAETKGISLIGFTKNLNKAKKQALAEYKNM